MCKNFIEIWISEFWIKKTQMKIFMIDPYKSYEDKTATETSVATTAQFSNVNSKTDKTTTVFSENSLTKLSKKVKT